MSHKIGRNDSCPCGSGKKYKKCCIAEPTLTPGTLDFSWAKLRQTEGSVVDNHLLPYITRELSSEFLTTALDDLLPDELPEGMDEKLLFDYFFVPWFLFNWIPLDSFGIEKFEPEKTIAENYVQQHAKKLSSMERSFIEAMNQSYYSFYSILEVEFEKSIVVKDILLGTLHTLKERQATHHLKRGDVVFSRILTLDNQSIFVGMAPFVIPVRYQSGLLDFKKWLMEENDNQALSATLLRNKFEMELIDYFFEAMEAGFNSPLPTLLNTDGEPIVFVKSYFKLDLTPESALKQLLPLTLSKSPEEFLQNAECDESGLIKHIEFPWLKKGNKKHKNWANTIMGKIVISKDRLILETNSEKRAEHGKKLIEKYLGKAIRFQQMLIEEPKQKLKSLPNSSEKDQIEPDILKSPEIQAQLNQMTQTHWENWFDEPIPSLNHKTPREAAKTAEGKERLEALLLQYERYDAEETDNFLKADIRYLRTKLRLAVYLLKKSHCTCKPNTQQLPRLRHQRS